MMNKSEERVGSMMKPCIISIGRYSESMSLVVAKLHYDLVLGENGSMNIEPQSIVILTLMCFGIEGSSIESLPH